MEIIRKHAGEEGILIRILQKVQDAFDHVPKDAVGIISREMGISPVRIYGILTFYSQFRLEPPGRHTVTVCEGTACHVMGSRRISEYAGGKLGIGCGGTTDDGAVTLEHVACMGCCGMAPVVVVDSDIKGNQSITDMDRIIEGLLREEV